MDNPSDKLKSMGTQSKETVDLAAAKARETVEGARHAADQAIDKVADSVDDAKAGTAQAVDKAVGVAGAVAGRAQEHYREFKGQVRARAASVSTQVADYTEAEPLKAMLIAAAAGAVLMAVLSMMARSRE